MNGKLMFRVTLVVVVVAVVVVVILVIKVVVNSDQIPHILFYVESIHTTKNCLPKYRLTKIKKKTLKFKLHLQHNKLTQNTRK